MSHLNVTLSFPGQSKKPVIRLLFRCVRDRGQAARFTEPQNVAGACSALTAEQAARRANRARLDGDFLAAFIAVSGLVNVSPKILSFRSVKKHSVDASRNYHHAAPFRIMKQRGEKTVCVGKSSKGNEATERHVECDSSEHNPNH